MCTLPSESRESVLYVKDPPVYLLTAHCIPKKDPVLMSLVYAGVGEGHEEKSNKGRRQRMEWDTVLGRLFRETRRSPRVTREQS